tara:strand:- start:1680 stop:3542 length:1863 start_codon:yes stop_codon:yes gene_type:complete
MAKLFNPNIFFIIIFFSLLRFLDIDLPIKGSLFILISLLLIYIDQKKISKNIFILIIIYLSIFFILNEKKNIIEISSIFKVNANSEVFYQEIIGIKKYSLIKNKFFLNNDTCIKNITDCYENQDFKNKIIVSPDQLFFNINENFTRKISKINFSNLGNLRAPFVNTINGRINPDYIHKFDTPYIIKFTNLDSLKEICFKGYVIVDYIKTKNIVYDKAKTSCILNDSDIKEIVGLNYSGNNLEIYSKRSLFFEYIDEIFLLFFIILLILNINYLNIKTNLKLFLPTLTSVFVIFYISRFDLWFGVFNLFNFYFFGFEGGDGLTYINFVNDLYENFINGNIKGFIRGGESEFYFTPGFRYLLFINQIISGDFYYLYFFILFFLPKIINNFTTSQFGQRNGYILTLSFLLLPFLHHIGFSYYQFIRHAYRLYPESLGYMFFIMALTIFFTDFKNKYLSMNFLFALSVFLRPNLVLTVFIIVLLKTIKNKVNIFSLNYFAILFLILLIYLFPLIHNLYFANELTLFTRYGSNILNIENILSKKDDFYINKIFSINFLLLLLIFIPNLNNYLKIILITQYITIFWFDDNSRYYWVYWLASINLIYNLCEKIYNNKWKSQKIYISK